MARPFPALIGAQQEAAPVEVDEAGVFVAGGARRLEPPVGGRRRLAPERDRARADAAGAAEAAACVEIKQ